MNISEQYDRLWHEALYKFEQGMFEYDTWLDHPHDTRYGITLLARPDQQMKDHIRPWLHKLKALEPQQYYYPDSDLHLTVMSVISCHEGFHLTQISTEDYVSLIRKALQGFGKFRITFRGITASPSCILVQGFPHDNTLNDIRDSLRRHFSQASLQQSLDKRYTIQTAHSTIMRFRKPVQHPAPLVRLLKDMRHLSFGTVEVNSLQLVFNDWYQRKAVVKTLADFELNEP